MLYDLLALDLQLTTFLASLFPRSLFWIEGFSFFSFKGSAYVVWVCVLLGVLLWELSVHKNTHRYVQKVGRIFFVMTIAIILSLGMVQFFLKPLFERDRPYIPFVAAFPNDCPTDYSFPSGHTAAAFAGAFILSRFDHNRRRDILYVSIALLISYSRVYLTCHYLTDVIAGAIVGILIGASVIFVHDKYASRR
jgi:undecaprenyl-diphosphatase